MANWTNMRSRITASVRTTTHMNALLADSLIVKRKGAPHTVAGGGSASGNAAGAEKEPLRHELKFFRNNFSMERVNILIESIIEDRFTWDRLSRSYNPWRSLQLTASLASDIRNAVKKMNYRRHRIVCILSIIEKQSQGIHIRMRHSMNQRLDNFTKLVHERPSFFVVITVYLVYKE